MSERVIIIGAGGHAKVLADLIEAAGDTVRGFLDDGPAKEVTLKYPILGTISDAVSFPESSFVIAIGDNRTRLRIAQTMPLRWYTAIHPSAIISDSAVIGEGSMIMPNAVVNANAVIGRHCIINTASIVEHDDRIGDFVHISTRAALGGGVQVDDLTQVGIGACVRHCIHICEECVIGAGAVVVSDITDSGAYAGVPAKLLVKH